MELKFIHTIKENYQKTKAKSRRKYKEIKLKGRRFEQRDNSNLKFDPYTSNRFWNNGFEFYLLFPMSTHNIEIEAKERGGIFKLIYKIFRRLSWEINPEFEREFAQILLNNRLEDRLEFIKSLEKHETFPKYDKHDQKISKNILFNLVAEYVLDVDDENDCSFMFDISINFPSKAGVKEINQIKYEINTAIKNLEPQIRTYLEQTYKKSG